MSLQHAAQHLAAQGRGADTTLVHMTPREVSGLQAIARAHGGSLTINPETGLAEAGFLDKIMPTLVGAAGMYFGIDPMTTAAIMGGGTAMKTGDLGKGLMAGLGAYGGGSMMQSALGSGTASLAGTMSGGAQAAAGAGDMTAGMNAATNADKLAAFNPSVAGLGGYKNIAMAAAPAIMGAMQPQGAQPPQSTGMIRPYTFDYNKQQVSNPIGTTRQDGQDTSERLYFQPKFTPLTPYKAAAGGLMSLAGGGPVEQMSNANAIGANTGYPMADINKAAYATPYQTPVSQNVVQGSADTGVNPMTGEQTRFAAGGLSTLGGYSDGGRLLKGPGDGMSDNIPAQIGAKQPARLADGEFVVPADVVSHLGNGSTDAGAKQLYKMMDRIRAQRTGKKKQAPEVNPAKAMPA
jgi:hypothetical protein